MATIIIITPPPTKPKAQTFDETEAALRERAERRIIEVPEGLTDEQALEHALAIVRGSNAEAD